MAYFPTATLTYATLPSPRSVAAGDFYLTKDAGQVWSDGSQWNVVAGTFPTSTLANLPAIPTLPYGVLVVTTDVGLVSSNGSGGWFQTGNAPATLTTAGIQAAINAVSAAGGGVVQLPAGLILLSGTITPASGVKLRGIAPQLVYNTIPDSGLTTLVGSNGGTILQPTGAFPAISWNTAVLGVPASQTAFSQAALTNMSIEDMGFSGAGGGTWAIQAGNTNNPSAWYSQFKNLYATGFIAAGGGGFNIANYQHCVFDENYGFGCAWGHLHVIDVAAVTLAPGNSRYGGFYNVNPVGSGANALLARSITYLTTATTGGAADNNEFHFLRIQSNRFGGTNITQAATMVNTQTNITITDGTKFAVGLPVSVDATQNGFTLKKVYFVVSVVGNVIQLANTYGGAAIAATGANAVNIVHSGFPCFEMIALAGSQQTNLVIDNLDVEGLATAAIFFQNVSGFRITVSQVPGTAQATQSFVCRGCTNGLTFSPNSMSTDWDNNAVGQVMGFFGARFGTSVGYMGYGQWYDTVTNTFQTSFGNQNDKQGAAGLQFNPSVSGGILTPQNMGIGYVTKVVTSAAYAVAQLDCWTTNQTSASTDTLPTASVSNVGHWYGKVNRSGGTQTVSTDGTQLLNGIVGRISVTVANGGNALFLSVITSAGNYGWDVIPSGSMVAGAIAAAS